LVLIFPVPDSLDEGFSSDVVPGLFFVLEESAFDNGLGSDTSMINTGNPKGIETLHPFHTDCDVLQRVVESVSLVECTGNIRRRNDDTERLCCAGT
jgi:hypothetical protein